MSIFDSAPVDVPQLSPWLEHQQKWWSDLTRLPSPPSRQREAHEPLAYEESERLRSWRRDAEDVVERYESYLKTPDGAQDLADLDQSRATALDCIATISANDSAGECRQRYLNAGPFYEFLKVTAHPAIALLKHELRLRLAEYHRERATRPSDTEFIGAEAAYGKHYEDRAEAIKRCEALLTTTYTTHAQAVEMLAKAKAAMADIGKIPRDQIYKVQTGGYVVDDMEEFARQRRRYAH